jgi:glycosylphosphatidylinositol transamidase
VNDVFAALRYFNLFLFANIYIYILFQLCHTHTDSRQPHSSALNHGIDSLTIELHIPNNRNSNNNRNNNSTTISSTTPPIHPHYTDMTRCVEHLLRSISNLHERLHHSVTQYTLVSITKFVSHGEYIFPAILVSVPMILRASMLALSEIHCFMFRHVLIVLLTVSMTSISLGMIGTYLSMHNSSSRSIPIITTYVVCYALVITCIIRQKKKRKKGDKVTTTTREEEDIHKSVRFVTCLLGIYLHAPLLLANYPLGFVSSLFWSPLLGIFVLSSTVHNRLVLCGVILAQLARSGQYILLFITSSPILLVPRIFQSYTAYVCCVYTPLHLLLTVLWLT